MENLPDLPNEVEAKRLWLSTENLTSAIPSKHPAGSVLFFPNTRHPLSEYAIALRVDHIDDGGDLNEALMWLRGDPWGQGDLTGFIDNCRDHHLNDKQVLGLAPSRFKTQLQIELTGAATAGTEISWQNGVGLVATGHFGFMLVGGVKAQYNRTLVRLIDPSTWSSDEKVFTLRPIAREWLRDWRIALRKPSTDDLLTTFSIKRAAAS